MTIQISSFVLCLATSWSFIDGTSTSVFQLALSSLRSDEFSAILLGADFLNFSERSVGSVMPMVWESARIKDGV